MNVWVLIVFIAVAALLVYVKRSGVPRDKAHALVEQGAALLDVRTGAEFAAGHLPGAVNIPVDELRARHQELGDTSRPVVVYCASGTRSLLAKRVLLSLGHKEIYNLGGLHRW